MRCFLSLLILIPIVSFAQVPLDSLSESAVEFAENFDLQPLRNVESKTWLFYTLLIPVLLFAYLNFNFGKDLLAIWVAGLNLTIPSGPLPRGNP